LTHESPPEIIRKGNSMESGKIPVSFVVLTQNEEFDCFLRTKMDVLVLGHTMVERV